MASPPHVELTRGFSFSAAATAWTMNAMNVRLTPSRCRKSDFTASRSATSPVTSASTVLQASGIWLVLLTMLSAMVRRTGVRGTRSSSALSASDSAVSAARPATWASTSLRVTRPPMPLPCTADRSTPCSAASRRTAGEYRGPETSPTTAGPPDPVGPTGATSLSSVPVSEASGTVPGTAAGASSWSSGSSPSTSISAITAPIGTVCPSATTMADSTPVAGEGISMVTLSVTTSTTGSYFSIRSPTLFSHGPI